MCLQNKWNANNWSICLFLEALSASVHAPDLSKEGTYNYLHDLHHSLVSVKTTGREYSPAHQQKIGLKIYWEWPQPSEQDLVFPIVSLSHQEASISVLTLSVRGQTEWKPQSQKTNQTDHVDHSFVKLKPCHVGPPKTDGSWWSILTKHGPLEKGPLQCSCLEHHEKNKMNKKNPMNIMKRQKDMNWKMNSPGW